MPGLKRKRESDADSSNAESEEGGSTAKMDDKTRAMCYAYRNPGPGEKKLKLWQIQELLVKKDGEAPSPKRCQRCLEQQGDMLDC